MSRARSLGPAFVLTVTLVLAVRLGWAQPVTSDITASQAIDLLGKMPQVSSCACRKSGLAVLVMQSALLAS